MSGSSSAVVPPSVLMTDSVMRLEMSAHSSREGKRTVWDQGMTAASSSSVSFFHCSTFFARSE